MIYNFDALSFQILTIDRFCHKNGFFNVKARSHAAISFRVSGTGAFQIGGKSFLVKPGNVLFLPADTPYQVEYSVSESIVANLKFCNYTETEVFALKNTSEISVLFLKLLEEWKQRRSVNQAKATLYKILDKIDHDKEIAAEDTALASCLRYIEEHFCDCSLNIGAVCEAGFISPSGLQRMFLQRFGISPKQYIIKLRMNRALELLVENMLPVREIALACGFFDEKYFSRIFKQRYGFPPSQLRKNTIV